ncbi:hypothetical protein EBZ39_02580 [bacterium]|nr:hypothetical protein [bacterium]
MSTCDSPLNPPEIEAQFPAGSAPENRIDKVSALCSYGMRPHVMTGLLRQLLITHFSDPANIDDARVRRIIEELGGWKPSDSGLNQIGLLIESITRWNPTNSDKRPAILIKRNTWQWSRQVIGDHASADLALGATNYLGFWQGSHSLYCLAHHGGEAEFLATEVMKFLVTFGPIITDQMNLLRFYVSEIGGLAMVQEAAQGYVVPITVTYIAQELWELQPQVPRLKRIVFKASELLDY